MSLCDALVLGPGGKCACVALCHRERVHMRLRVKMHGASEVARLVVILVDRSWT